MRRRIVPLARRARGSLPRRSATSRHRRLRGIRWGSSHVLCRDACHRAEAWRCRIRLWPRRSSRSRRLRGVTKSPPGSARTRCAIRKRLAGPISGRHGPFTSPRSTRSNSEARARVTDDPCSAGRTRSGSRGPQPRSRALLRPRRPHFFYFSQGIVALVATGRAFLTFL